MPLITIKSNLTNIKFGNDRPLGGSSKQPYIKFPVPSQFATEQTINGSNFFTPQYANLNPGQVAPTEFLDLYKATRDTVDFPIRGGGLDFNLGTQTFTLSSKLDKTRIKRFFEDAPRGTAFIQKQIGLQLSNPKIETGNTLYGFGQSVPFPGLLENTRVYNKGANTLAQVGVQGTGLHATRHGLIPFNPGQKQYYDIVNAQNVNNTIATNRLLILNNLKMGTTANEKNNQFINPNTLTDINTVNSLGISLNKNLIFQYLGGPGSVYGIGTTTIKRVVDTTRLRSSRVMTYDQLKSQTINNITDGVATTNIQDFRTQLGYYDPPNNWLKKDSIDYKFYVSPGQYKDKMNLLYPFVFENTPAPWELDKTGTDDLIKFVFEAISNDDPSYSMALFFRAFLTAGITDNNSAQLNAFKYMGRGENFYTYQGFDRTIGFSFRVAAGSKDEIRPLYNKVNSLMSQVYPDYSAKQGIMRAPVVRITIGDYLYRVPGFIESINVTVDNNYPWEINLEKSQIGDIAQLPQVLDIAVSFKPIMDILPRRSAINKLVQKTTTNASYVSAETTTISTNIPALIANVGNKNSDQQSFIKPGEVIESSTKFTINSPKRPRTVQDSITSQFERLSNFNLPRRT
jgi:hypothetical protein